MTEYESAKRGYEADVSGDERDEDCFQPLSKKAKLDDRHAENGFGSEYCFSEGGLSVDEEELSMTCGPALGARKTETDTEVESACSEIESIDESESLGSRDTDEYESEHLSESLGSRDTSSEDPASDNQNDSGSFGVTSEADESEYDDLDEIEEEDSENDALSTASTEMH
jgi:hypothetical protein